MNIKRFFRGSLTMLIVMALVIAGLLCGCKTESIPQTLKPGYDSQGLPIIHFWSEGSQEEEAAFTELIQAYNALPGRKATVQLQFIRSGSFDAGISARYAEAYLAGEYQGFDIITGSHSAFVKTVAACGGDENSLLFLDSERLPNLENAKMVPSVYADRLAAYRGNCVVFAYDSAKIPQPPQTWEELTQWILENPGRFTYCDPDFGDTGDAFLTVSLHRLMGTPEAFSDPANPKWVGMTDAGFAWLKQIHPSLYASGGRIQYPSKDMAALELLSSGEVWMVPAMVDDVLRGLEQNTLPASVKICQMSDHPFPGYDIDLAICATTHSAEGCYDFLNFILSTAGQQQLLSSLKTIPAVDPSTLEQTALTAALADLDSAALFTLDTGDNSSAYRIRWAEEIATIG